MDYQATSVGAITGMYFIDQSLKRPKITDFARCIVAKYNAGLTKHVAANSGVIETCPVKTSDCINRQNGRRLKNTDKPMILLKTKDRYSVVINDYDSASQQRQVWNVRIRRLTPRECFRLQGFNDRFFEKAQSVNSDAQLYRQAGNAVTVNVAFAIASKLGEVYI